ncbi:hypothetical protein [Dinghuibacter silviterrae]|uniref:Uncharacterized protein n=1 Tax=Dinghuibacter silviterrae TaxID=1539049 RepID=A0A4R8DUV2_9BACT|nr:hypothetical protein [Dinghuibacter silviterrae]TDX02180.1 hypothetical protein EDB95_3231 [Dinghuibacter silviterrae]
MSTLLSAVVNENNPLRLTTDQLISRDKALADLYSQFTLHNMREVLWEVFSRSIVVKDDELGSYSRPELLRYYDLFVQVIELGFFVAKDYNRAVATRNDFIHGRPDLPGPVTK